uniref:Protein zwilch homolog n=1 Tax=Ciona savignyi TaxID=51511 RepID=H2ZLY8_CIOSA
MLNRTMEGLRKLHHVTELATLCQANLMLPVEKIRSAVRSALQSYVAEEVNFHKLFSFDVSLTDVKWIIESSSPSVWRVNKLGANAFGEDSGSACWTRDFPFSGLVQQPAVNCDMSNLSVTSQDEITDAYYVTTA